MDGDKSVQANFSSRVNLQVLTRGGGSVTDLTDLGSYAVDATATITAVPLPGWEFALDRCCFRGCDYDFCSDEPVKSCHRQVCVAVC